MSNLKELRSSIKEGLFVNNLKKLIKLCSQLAQQEESPLPFYLLRSIFMDFASKWEGEAVSASEIKAAEAKLMGRIDSILAQCENKGAKGISNSDLSLLVKESISLFG